MDKHPLRQWRDENKVTLDDLADRVDVSPSMLSMLETGDRGASLELALKLAAETGIQPDAFLKSAA